MSSRVCHGSLTVSLRNILNSIQCIRDRVRDGESNESDGAFNLSNFWHTLNQAVQAVSQEATKLSLAFSRPPPPSQQDGEKLSESMLKSVLTLSTVYYWLPKSQGATLRRQVRDATVEVLEGVAQLLEVLLSSPLPSLTQDQLTSTGGVWSACDQFDRLPKENKAALLVVLSSQTGLVKDAMEEMDQALSEAEDPFIDVLDDGQDEGDPGGNRDTYWSERDLQLIDPCRGLMKAAAGSLRKLASAVTANGDTAVPHNVSQLDDLADMSREISPSVDDLVLCLYPPMDHSAVEDNVSKLAALLKKFLEMIRSSHVCGELELTWVQFLEGAVDHNLLKATALVQLDS